MEDARLGAIACSLGGEACEKLNQKGAVGRITQMGLTATFEAPKRRLSALPLLISHDKPSFSTLEPALECFCLLGGQILFRESNVADALSVVLAGCPSVTASGSGRDVSTVNRRAGEMVGEMALLGDGLRLATITALRDTELLATVSGEAVAIAIRARTDSLLKSSCRWKSSICSMPRSRPGNRHAAEKRAHLAILALQGLS